MTQSRPEVIFVKNGKGRGKRLGESALLGGAGPTQECGCRAGFSFPVAGAASGIIGWLLAEKIWPRWCHFREG